MKTNLLFNVLYEMYGFPGGLRPETDYGKQFRTHVNSFLDIGNYDQLHILLKPGQRSNEAYFVNKGGARGFMYDEKGEKQHTIYLWGERCFVVPANAFYFQQPADMYIEVLPGTELVLIPRSGTEEALARFPEAQVLGRTLAWQYNEYHRQRERMFRLPAEDRYKLLLKEWPGIESKFPLNVIASFLAMTPETLSRVKASTNLNS